MQYFFLCFCEKLDCVRRRASDRCCARILGSIKPIFSVQIREQRRPLRFSNWSILIAP